MLKVKLPRKSENPSCRYPAKKLTVRLPVNPRDTAVQNRYIANVRSKGTRHYSWCADRLGDDLEMYSQKPYELVCRVKYTLR